MDVGVYADIQIPIGRLKRLMGEGSRRKSYAALVATTILSDKNYIEIERQLVEKGKWDAGLSLLKRELECCGLI